MTAAFWLALFSLLGFLAQLVFNAGFMFTLWEDRKRLAADEKRLSDDEARLAVDEDELHGRANH